MTFKQIAAARTLEKALKKCKDAGLRGHVFEGSLCVCPNEIEPQEDFRGGKSSFEDTINEKGLFLQQHGMHWDGATA